MNYRVTAICAAQPNHVVLHEYEHGRARAELIAFHVVLEERDSRNQLVLAVPLSWDRAGFDLGELVAGFEDSFWDCRVADTDTILARLDDVRGCSPVCSWSAEYSAHDGSTLDFILQHGPGCEEEQDDDGPAELEAA